MQKAFLVILLMVTVLVTGAEAQTGLKGPQAKNHLHRATENLMITKPVDHLQGGQAKNRSLVKQKKWDSQLVTRNLSRTGKNGPQAKNYRPGKEL